MHEHQWFSSENSGCLVVQEAGCDAEILQMRLLVELIPVRLYVYIFTCMQVSREANDWAALNSRKQAWKCFGIFPASFIHGLTRWCSGNFTKAPRGKISARNPKRMLWTHMFTQLQNVSRTFEEPTVTGRKRAGVLVKLSLTLHKSKLSASVKTSHWE